MLLKKGYAKYLNSMQGLGYRHVIDYLYGKTTREETIRLMARDTRRYAKRQYTWFLRDKTSSGWMFPVKVKEDNNKYNSRY